MHRQTTGQRGYGTAWQQLSREQRARQPQCFYCGATDDLTTDHLRPLARGGSADDGVVTACRTCNSARRDGRPSFDARQRAEPPTVTTPSPEPDRIRIVG